VVEFNIFILFYIFYIFFNFIFFFLAGGERRGDLSSCPGLDIEVMIVVLLGDM
jgi:hypothetical protein